MSQEQPQLNAIIVGASGYTGAQLAAYLHQHPHIHLTGLMVSAQSADAGKKLSELHPCLTNVVDMVLQGCDAVSAMASLADVVFLATAHEVSHHLVPQFLAAGCVVFDLSGAYRVNQHDFYPQYYGFIHQYPELLKQAVYGLAEWCDERLTQAKLIALPGCYPTVSQLALKPLLMASLLNSGQWPTISAISGVSGAGRKANLTSSFCEVSLQPYGLFSHRHQPEISTHLGSPVVFIPHLGNFPRGILATITCRINQGVTEQHIRQCYQHAYHNKPLVRLYQQRMPSIGAVVNTPFCDIGFAMQGENLIVIAAEDNLLKGAAAQAVQCMNMRFGFAETLALR